MGWLVSALLTASLVTTVVAVCLYFLPVMFVPTWEPDFDDVDALAKRDRVSPGQPAGDAGTGLVPPAVAARPGEITEERRN